MLGQSRVHPVLLSTDLAATRVFYHDKLGLEILVENEHALEFRCGEGTKLVVTRSDVGTADSQTKIGWEVADLRAEVDDVQRRGIAVEDYDLPDLKTTDGIADFGFAWMAWIVDPGGNALSMLQYRE
jgi:catechol 2,3-dioxygenase-like lactoylglutathione lyase family enzyme